VRRICRTSPWVHLLAEKAVPPSLAAVGEIAQAALPAGQIISANTIITYDVCCYFTDLVEGPKRLGPRR
jgi:hypothetical protein